MAILKFSKFKKERAAIKESKSKQAAAQKHLALYTEKLKEFKVSSPSELSEDDQIKFYDSLKPLMEAAEKANPSGKDVVTLPKDGEEDIEEKTKKEKETLNDDKGGAKVVTESDDKGSAKSVAKEKGTTSVVDKTKDEGKEKSGESGEAKEDQKGDKITPLKQEGDTPASKETVNASGKVLETQIADAKAALKVLEACKADEDEARKVKEGNEFSAARQTAIDAGEDEFEVGGKKYKVTGDKDSPSMASTK